MSPSVSRVWKKLSYPLYAADFDPLNQDFLLVGGGGGSTSSGVPNKITLLDVSRRDELSEIADIELAKNEDSVSTLAISESSDTSLTAFAGINSSSADQEVGKNEHFRSFRVGLPAKKRRADGLSSHIRKDEKLGESDASTQSLGRTALFRSARLPKNETYQRVLRLSSMKKAGEPRLAAVASGLAPENEVLVFRPASSPNSGDEVSRIGLGKDEAADVDLINTEPGQFTLAYCTQDEVFLQQLSNSKNDKSAKPKSIYKCPDSTLPPSKRPRFRGIRFITPHHILLLQNKPARTGVNILVVKLNQDLSRGYVTIKKTLNKSTKLAVGLDVCCLTESETGEKQTIVAVAGQDSSVEILTIDYVPSTGLRTFKPYTVLRDVHSGPLTRLVFANFLGPPLPITKDVRPQSVRLTSVGIDQTVVIHNLHLRPYPVDQHRMPRYVLTPPGSSETLQTTFSVFVALFVVGFGAFLMQAFCEIRGAVPPTLGATDWLSPRAQRMIARPYIFANQLPIINPSDIPIAEVTQKIKESIPDVEDVKSGLKDLLYEQEAFSSDPASRKAIIVRDEGAGELSTEVRDHQNPDEKTVKQETLRKWEDLNDHEKESWKEKLQSAGHWAEAQGESILKGILFSEFAGFVGQAIGGG